MFVKDSCKERVFLDVYGYATVQYLCCKNEQAGSSVRNHGC